MSAYFSFICWVGNVSQKDKNDLQRIVDISCKVTSLKQSILTALYKKKVLHKTTKTLTIIRIFYIMSTSCRHPEGLESSNPKQSVDHSFQYLYDFSTTSTSDISMKDVSFIVCMLYFYFVMFNVYILF